MYPKVLGNRTRPLPSWMLAPPGPLCKDSFIFRRWTLAFDKSFEMKELRG
jgi:hypothetical protein